MGTIDLWSTREENGRWYVVDRNGCHVADCGDRKDDAELIVHYARGHQELVAALKAAGPYLESFYENLESCGMAFPDAEVTVTRARTVLLSIGGGNTARA
ncbi:MAG: hypothetical protein E4H03_09140 [Myxococcales bacterium]|nr:MAG: hypothetical protein E4H03_09140 [Myxococcales bacterium]